jgi:hypothetical protein
LKENFTVQILTCFTLLKAVLCLVEGAIEED